MTPIELWDSDPDPDSDSDPGAHLILLCVLRDPPQPTFQHMVSVQKRHLGAGFEPDLVLGVLRNDVQSGHSQLKLSRLRELSQTRAETDQVVATDIRRFPDQGLEG